MSDSKKQEKIQEKQKIRIKIMAYDHKIIDQSARMILDTATRTGAKTSGPIPLPTNIKKYTVLNSTFVHKNIHILDPTPKTIDSLMNLSLPAGVDIEIKMH